MNRGLFYKSWRESRLQIFIFGIVFFVFENVLAFVLPLFADSMGDQFLQLPFVQNFLSALLGIQLDNQLTASAIQALAWVHPVILAIVWAQVIIFCTRVPAGEIDRGSVDMVMALPVSRWEIYWVETTLWLTGGCLLMVMGFLGNRLGLVFYGNQQPASFNVTGLILVNLFFLYLAVGGLAMLVSVLSDRKGKAMGVVFGLVLGSFFFNFVAQLWVPAQRFSFLSLLHYYRPMDLVRTGQWPWGDLLVLGFSGFGLWLLGGILFSRRDICTT